VLVNEADVRTAVRSAGLDLWNPQHMADRELTGVSVEDVVSLPVGWLAIGRAVDGTVLVAPVIEAGGGLRRARPGDGVVASLLDVLRAGGTSSLEVAAVRADIPSGGVERWMGVDQANESYVIGETVVMKLFPRMGGGPHPAVEIAAHLRATGFEETPSLLGALRWRGEVLLATASVYVPGARDGWEWYVELVQRASDGGSWADADASAASIGALVARLHRALATPSDVLPDPTGTADASTVAEWHARAVATLEEAVAVTPDAAGERLHRLAPRARAVIDRLTAIEATPIQRIHGDLHVGQILRDEAGSLWINDFDGNPFLAAEARSAKDAAARDVASMACAIDHVGRVAIRRVPEAHDVVADWIERARATFLSTYRRELGDAAALFDARLVHAFSIEQEAHEYRYASTHVPRWRYVPDAAMPAAIARAEADA
jgi:maltokinase